MMTNTTKDSAAAANNTYSKPNASSLMIDATNLSYGYPCGSRSSKGYRSSQPSLAPESSNAPQVLNIPQWQVARGEQLFLHGPSGSGKSTLLQLLCGLRTGNGALKIAGTALNELPMAQRDHFRAQNIGMVFQQFNLIPYLSTLDNITLAAHLANTGLTTSAAQQRAIHLLAQIGLAQPVWKQPANTLSIGQQQRVAIARALINCPRLLLLDEPTSALDEANQTLFINALFHHLEQHPSTTVIFVSHNKQLASHFKRSVCLSELSVAQPHMGATI